MPNKSRLANKISDISKPLADGFDDLQLQFDINILLSPCSNVHEYIPKYVFNIFQSIVSS